MPIRTPNNIEEPNFVDEMKTIEDDDDAVRNNNIMKGNIHQHKIIIVRPILVLIFFQE